MCDVDNSHSGVFAALTARARRSRRVAPSWSPVGGGVFAPADEESPTRGPASRLALGDIWAQRPTLLYFVRLVHRNRSLGDHVPATALLGAALAIWTDAHASAV